MLNNIIFTEERNIFIETKHICLKINNKLQFCWLFVFSIFDIALQDANFEIVHVVIICIEMQRQRKKLFMSDRVCVIIKAVSEITASFSNVLCFWAFLALN